MRSRIDSWTGIALISSGARNPTWRDSELVASCPPVTVQAKQTENCWRTSPSEYSTT